MSKRSEAQRAALQKKCDEALKALQANGNAPRKPIALTLRLDRTRYARLSAHAARYMPRKSYQSILVAALDAYLGE